MAESRIIKRNVLFWGKSGLQLTGIMLIFMVVYGFLFNMGSSSIFGDFWKTAYFYGGIISVLFALIGPVAYVGAYLPMALSFGSGRREAVFGAQIFCIAYGVSTYIIMVLAGIMSSGKLDGKLDVLIAVLFIFMTAVGQLVSVAQMHFGMKGMILGIVMVVLCMVGGIVAGIGFIDEIMVWINGMQTNVVWILLAIGAIVSIALYAVSVMVLFREMRHYEVKAYGGEKDEQFFDTVQGEKSRTFTVFWNCCRRISCWLDHCIYCDECHKREFLCYGWNNAGSHRIRFYAFIWNQFFLYGGFQYGGFHGSDQKKFRCRLCTF